MKYFVNADDYGKDESVTRAICECFEKDLINTTTAMINMPFAEEAYKIAVKKGIKDKVGLHINLTEGMPLTDSIRMNPLMCDKDGRFHAAFAKTTKYRLYMDQQSVGQIREEIGAQIERYLEFGYSSMHIDSHHHVHTNYPIFKVLKSYSKKYDFSYVRLSRNMYTGGNPVMNIYKSLYNFSVKRICKETSELFGSYEDFRVYAEEGHVFRSSDIEIMIHPMYDESGFLIDSTSSFINDIEEEHKYIESYK